MISASPETIQFIHSSFIHPSNEKRAHGWFGFITTQVYEDYLKGFPTFFPMTLGPNHWELCSKRGVREPRNEKLVVLYEEILGAPTGTGSFYTWRMGSQDGCRQVK